MMKKFTFHVGPRDDSLERSSVQQIHDLLLRLNREITVTTLLRLKRKKKAPRI